MRHGRAVVVRVSRVDEDENHRRDPYHWQQARHGDESPTKPGARHRAHASQTRGRSDRSAQ
jgi:hypothetical protein